MRCSVAAAGTENIGSPALELRFPRCDLIGVDVELFRQLSQRSIALDGGKRQPSEYFDHFFHERFYFGLSCRTGAFHDAITKILEILPQLLKGKSQSV
jgi:hypothetical protein